MSAAATSLQVDWQVVSAAIATFCGTVYITWKGWKDRKKEVTQPTTQTEIMGGMLRDTVNLVQNTASLVDLKEEVHDLTQEIRHNTAEMKRMTDILLMTNATSRR